MVGARNKERLAIEALARGRRVHGRGKNPSLSPRLPLSAGHPCQNQNQRGRRAFVWKGKEEKAEREEDRSALSSQKVHVQTGSIRPFSARSPQPNVQTAVHGPLDREEPALARALWWPRTAPLIHTKRPGLRTQGSCQLI